MFLVPLTLWALVGAGTGTATERDPAALVSRLGAGRYAERQAAAAALERLGRAALPALRRARTARDPEVRARAEELVERIESGLMVRPTLVRLDYRDRPLADVVKDLAEQSRLPLALSPLNRAAWQGRRVSIEAPDPVPFWTALDRICAAGHVRYVAGFNALGPSGRGPVVQLVAGAEGPPPPAVESGPFRVVLLGIYHNRTRMFTPAMPMGIFPGGNPPPPPQPAPAGQGTTTEEFRLDVQVLVEPRMTLATQGPLVLSEAIDDKGQSLLPPAAGPGATFRTAGFNGFPHQGGLAELRLSTPLRFPDQPGRTIKRLRGTLPVVVSARKDDPLVIDLVGAKGKSVRASEVTLIVNDVRPGPDNPAETLLDLSLRPNSPGNDAQGLMGRMVMFNDLGLRTSGAAHSQFQIVDAKGRAYPQWVPQSHQFNPDEIRMLLRLTAAGALGPPAQVRFYDSVRAATEVAFEFTDVPMP